MKISIESTTKLVELNGIPARIWEGTTESGIKVHCFITRIAVNKNDATAIEEFDRELQECAAPSPEVENSYPTRLVL